MDLFLLLTALLCGLTGTGRGADVRGPAVAVSPIVAVAKVAAPATTRAVAPRPDGYVAPVPPILDLAMASRFAIAITPERRRE